MDSYIVISITLSTVASYVYNFILMCLIMLLSILSSTSPVRGMSGITKGFEQILCPEGRDI